MSFVLQSRRPTKVVDAVFVRSRAWIARFSRATAWRILNELRCLENSSAIAQALAAGAPDFRFSGGSQSLKFIRNLEGLVLALSSRC